jgi:sigma-B regulation protein RsbU (phosphoserine phosphatase)
MADKLEAAYKMVDYEMKIVADIQLALLPAELPSIPNLRLAAHYQTSRRAGGDYYDFFPLPGGKWGILLADASGHGAPAAVVMAITHSIAHSIPERPSPPARMLNYLNEQLADRYTARFGGFVTAFYGIFDPATRGLRYASAGHNPPRVKQCGCGTLRALDRVGQFPLGIASGLRFEEATVELQPGDRLALYTDGITEASNTQGEAFGTERLDAALAHCGRTATELVQAVVEAVDEFTAGQPPEDDRTLVVAEVA